MCNHQSSGKHCVFFGFASNFEKVLMEEDVRHGGMIIKCWCYFELECCLCVFNKLVGRKFWRFWLWCGWIKWVAKDGLEHNEQGGVGFVLKRFFFGCKCTFSLLSFLNCCVQDVHWIQNLLFPLCSYIKLGQELVLLHEIKWALMWRLWFVEREKIRMFVGNSLDSQFVIQTKVGER
jgi:hypothetical protein